MPSLNASPVRSAERSSTTSSSSVRITSDASSTSTAVSTTKRVRTEPSGTSSRFDGRSRQTAASTQSAYSVGSITTIGVSLDGTCARSPRADEICSQHGRSVDSVFSSQPSLLPQQTAAGVCYPAAQGSALDERGPAGLGG